MMKQRMKSRKNNLGWNSAAQVLGSLLPDLPIAGRVDEYQVWEIWDEVVGVRLARKARPSKIQNGKLFVTVSHPAVIQELQFIKAALRHKLNQRLKTPLVKTIFFTVGRPQEFAVPRSRPVRYPVPPFSELQVPELGKPEIEQAFASLLAKRRRRLAPSSEDDDD